MDKMDNSRPNIQRRVLRSRANSYSDSAFENQTRHPWLREQLEEIRKFNNLLNQEDVGDVHIKQEDERSHRSDDRNPKPADSTLVLVSDIGRPYRSRSNSFSDTTSNHYSRYGWFQNMQTELKEFNMLLRNVESNRSSIDKREPSSTLDPEDHILEGDLETNAKIAVTVIVKADPESQDTAAALKLTNGFLSDGLKGEAGPTEEKTALPRNQVRTLSRVLYPMSLFRNIARKRRLEAEQDLSVAETDTKRLFEWNRQARASPCSFLTENSVKIVLPESAFKALASEFSIRIDQKPDKQGGECGFPPREAPSANKSSNDASIKRDLKTRGAAIFDMSEVTELIQLLKGRMERVPQSLACTENKVSFVEMVEQLEQIIDPVPFKSALEKFNQIIPDCDARNRYTRAPTRCLANNQTGERCLWKMGEYRHGLGVDEGTVSGLLNELEGTNANLNGPQCLARLKELTRIAVCDRGPRDGPTQREAVNEKLEELFSAGTGPTDSEYSSGQPPSLPSTAGKNPAYQVPRIKKPFVPNIRYWLRSSKRDIHYVPMYKLYYHRPLTSAGIDSTVRAHARKILLTDQDVARQQGFRELSETAEGYLYVYWNRAAFGHLKIGCTTKTVDERLSGWRGDCRHSADELYRSEKVPHVARLEKLIHAEFSNHRVKELGCRGCGIMHIEWFRNLELTFVKNRIEVWIDWIKNEPYQKGPTGIWRLKPEVEMSLPLTSSITPSAPITPRKATPRRHSTQNASPKMSSKSPRKRTPSRGEARVPRYDFRCRPEWRLSLYASSPTQASSQQLAVT